MICVWFSWKLTWYSGAAKDVLRKTGLFSLLSSFMNWKEIQLHLLVLLCGRLSYVVIETCKFSLDCRFHLQRQVHCMQPASRHTQGWHTVCPGNPAPVCACASGGIEGGQMSALSAWLWSIHWQDSVASGDMVKGEGLDWRAFSIAVEGFP